jgi:hypothetical protein
MLAYFVLDLKLVMDLGLAQLGDLTFRVKLSSVQVEWERALLSVLILLGKVFPLTLGRIFAHRKIKRMNENYLPPF